MSKPALVIVEDDAAFAATLERSFLKRGYDVRLCNSLETLKEVLTDFAPSYAVVDLKVIGGSGLECVRELHGRDEEMRIVVLTGFASIATAVEAIKLGATHYLAKPTDVEAILAAFEATAPQPDIAPPSEPLSVDRLEWEHIQRVLKEHDGNISSTARALKMHRRTLQRKLMKKPVRS